MINLDFIFTDVIKIIIKNVFIYIYLKVSPRYDDINLQRLYSKIYP